MSTRPNTIQTQSTTQSSPQVRSAASYYSSWSTPKKAYSIAPEITSHQHDIIFERAYEHNRSLLNQRVRTRYCVASAQTSLTFENE